MLAKAFVTTVSAVACGKTTPPAPEEPSRNPPAQLVDAAAADAPADAGIDAAVQTRLRKRTKRAVYATPDGTRPGEEPKLLNPKDANGRVVLTRPDDVCVVAVPPKEPRPSTLPTGLPWRSLERVDCPPEMDDPAWDDCTDRLVADEGAGRCFCVPEYGNPPPPPRANACPKGAIKHKKMP
jgi:hypothetical protein